MTQTCVDITRVRLFSGMTRASLQEIAHMTRISKVKKGQSIYQAGEQAACLYFLLDGWVKVLCANADGRELTLHILGPGEVFGEECILGGDLYGTTVEALEDSLIAVISKVDFVRVQGRHVHLAIGLAKLINHRLRKTHEQVADLVFHTVRDRLAHLLLTYYKALGAADDFSGCVKLTQQEMANLIGCSREAVSTAMGHFRNAGLVHYLHHTITRVDAERLSRLLRESPHSPLLASEGPAMRRSVRPSTRGLHTGASSRAVSRVASGRSGLPARSSSSMTAA